MVERDVMQILTGITHAIPFETMLYYLAVVLLYLAAIPVFYFIGWLLLET